MRDDIMQVINENQEFFGDSRFDVAESLKGRLYFVEYAAGNNEYMSFCEFGTAQQLREIIESISGGTSSGKSENTDLTDIINDLKALNRSLSETIDKLDRTL
ncbi:MAG: hypothetical protein K2M91_00795 [Lachnospiraceae bacterium]|nr:hypothetical protein [Lachnospiraceae bacterium]